MTHVTRTGENFLHFYSGMEVLSLHFRGFRLHKYNNHMIIWLMAFIFSYGIMFEIWHLTKSLLHYTTYFSFWRNFIEQKEGSAMGSPISAVVANLYMELFEELALETAPTRPTQEKREWQPGCLCLQETHTYGIPLQPRWRTENPWLLDRWTVVMRKQGGGTIFTDLWAPMTCSLVVHGYK